MNFEFINKLTALLLLLVVLRVHFVICGGKYNVTYADLDKCKEYDAKSGYNYRDYFKIQRSTDPLVIKLIILGSENAHILLSSDDRPVATSPIYEIVLGAGGNTFSDIRKRKKEGSLSNNKRTLNLLSALDPLPITITIPADGTLLVQIIGESEPLLKNTEPNLFPVNYISFGSWGKAQIKYFYDCSEKEDDNNLQESDHPLPISEQILSSLETNYEYIKVPENLEHVLMQFEMNDIAYRKQESALQLRGKVRLEWRDPKLTWNPDDYNGVNRIYNSDNGNWHFIWKPQISITNGVYSYLKNVLLSSRATIYSDGLVKVETFDTSIKTWCAEDDLNVIENSWPTDVLNCELQVALTEANVSLKALRDTFMIIKINSEQSEWHLDSSALIPVKNSEVRPDYGHYFSKIDIRYGFRLKRNSLFYQRVFCSPIMISWIFLLASFWTKNFLRATLNLLGTLILSIMFIVMADFAPNAYVPRLIQYYQASLFLSWISFLLFTLQMWLAIDPPKVQIYSCITRILQSTWFRLSIGIGLNGPCNHYLQMKSEEDNITTTWDDIKLIIDRVSFMIYLFVFTTCVIVGL